MRCERGLANLERIAPQVVAVQLNEIEGVEKGTVVVAVVANEIERGNAVVIAGNSLAVDDAGARAHACQRLHDQREAVGEATSVVEIELVKADQGSGAVSSASSRTPPFPAELFRLN